MQINPCLHIPELTAVEICWFHRNRGLKQRQNKQCISDAEWLDCTRGVLTAVDEPLTNTLFIISKENNQQRSRAACWSFPRWWQDGLWDMSFYPLLQLHWQRWMARWKKEKKNWHEDESAQSDFVSLYLCKPRPWWFMGKIMTISSKEQDVWQTEPGELWVYFGIRQCSG